MLDCATDSTGDVSSKQASGCLGDFVNHVHLVGHKGWAPLRGTSNKNFGLYSHATSVAFVVLDILLGNQILDLTGCVRIDFAMSAAKMNVQFD